MIAGDAIVFGWYDFAAETGTVFCFDFVTLQPRWRWQIPWPWRQRTLRPTVAVIASGEHVYAAATGKDGDNLFAFRLADGRLLWRRGVEAFPTESALALTGWHPMGTCRMSRSPEHGVVGPYGEVFGTRGLYVADASMLPSCVGVNPQVTIMAFATRTAEHLATRAA